MGQKLNSFLQLVAALSLQYGSVVVNGQSYVLTSCGVVTEGNSCVLNCETSSATETSISWTTGTGFTYNVERATCTTPSASTIPSDYVFDCPGTSFTLNITSASVTRDKTTWTCDAAFGGKDSTVNLDVQATTTTATTTSSTKDISTSTPGGPTTSTPNHEGICKDNLCYLFLLLLLIPIGVIVWCCVKKKKTKKSDQENSNKMAEINKPVARL